MQKCTVQGLRLALCFQERDWTRLASTTGARPTGQTDKGPASQSLRSGAWACSLFCSSLFSPFGDHEYLGVQTSAPRLASPHIHPRTLPRLLTINCCTGRRRMCTRRKCSPHPGEEWLVNAGGRFRARAKLAATATASRSQEPPTALARKQAHRSRLEHSRARTTNAYPSTSGHTP